ncbi:hypothetical protein A0256_19610 [Mucilaginibacter sp. PAMC 26640]|nr:hypothetical protein A0256_19610 [Mucilaginibacter sp. PAMC 26640]
MNKIEAQESFNARYLSYEDIAKTFIPNDQFYQLVTNNHTLLMGPRGSGKTTLLKMLAPPGQFYLDRYKTATDINLGFIGIYIPTDIQWNKQIEVFLSDENYSRKIKETFPRFLVTTNILICLVNTFIQVLELKSNHEHLDILSSEIDLAHQIINFWGIEKPVSPTLNSIKQSLYLRLTRANTLLKRLRYSNELDEGELPNYFFEDYFDLLVLGCNAFESIFEKGNALLSRKWALCFDELEISPDWLQKDLLEKIRSVDQRFIFKLTTSPIVSIVDKIYDRGNTIQAREDEDFKVIRTWNYDFNCQQQWNKFSDQLVTQKIARFFSTDVTPKIVFGEDSDERNLKNVFPRNFLTKPRPKSVASLYEEGNYYWSLFKGLAAIDPSFKKFLEQKAINPNNPLPKSPVQMDQIFRKVKEIVLFRFHFKQNDLSIRKRRNPSLYYGIPAIYEICDGNPRFLISLIDSLLFNLNEPLIKLNINLQSQIITDYSQKYLNLIASHPDSNKEIAHGRNLNLATLISQIGTFFFDRLVRDEFKMNKPTTFWVDKDVPAKILELIELGVHLGAFIYLDPKKVVSKEGLLGVKFRLSYLLHPHFRLPKREYDTIMLSTILKNKKKQSSLDQLTISI